MQFTAAILGTQDGREGRLETKNLSLREVNLLSYFCQVTCLPDRVPAGEDTNGEGKLLVPGQSIQRPP